MIKEQLVRSVVGLIDRYIAAAPASRKRAALEQVLIEMRAVRDALARDHRVPPSVLGLSSAETWDVIIGETEALGGPLRDADTTETDEGEGEG